MYFYLKCLEEEDVYDVFDDDFDDDDDYYKPPDREGPVREGSITLRSYWCELPEVVSSGLLQNLTPEEKKMQEVETYSSGKKLLDHCNYFGYILRMC